MTKAGVRRQTFLEFKKKLIQNTESKSSEDSKTSLSSDNCQFVTKSKKYLKIHILKQHERLEQIDGNISLNSTIKEVVEDTVTIPKCEHMPYQKCDTCSKCDFCYKQFKEMRYLSIHWIEISWYHMLGEALKNSEGDVRLYMEKLISWV